MRLEALRQAARGTGVVLRLSDGRTSRSPPEAPLAAAVQRPNGGRMHPLPSLQAMARRPQSIAQRPPQSPRPGAHSPQGACASPATAAGWQTAAGLPPGCPAPLPGRAILRPTGHHAHRAATRPRDLLPRGNGHKCLPTPGGCVARTALHRGPRRAQARRVPAPRLPPQPPYTPRMADNASTCSPRGLGTGRDSSSVPPCACWSNPPHGSGRSRRRDDLADRIGVSACHPASSASARSCAAFHGRTARGQFPPLPSTGRRGTG